MPDPSELMTVAWSLAGNSEHAPTDAALRRAVSTIYYALFHAVLRAAARRFVGPDKQASAAYALLYRSFDHAHMRNIFTELGAKTLNKRLSRMLGRDAVRQEVRDFSNIFLVTQEQRLLADYNPSARFTPSNMRSLLAAADYRLYDIELLPHEELTDVLALLMVKLRS